MQPWSGNSPAGSHSAYDMATFYARLSTGLTGLTGLYNISSPVTGFPPLGAERLLRFQLEPTCLFRRGWQAT